MLTLAGDNDTWSVTVFGWHGDTPLQAPSASTSCFDAVVRACPLQAHWLDGAADHRRAADGGRARPLSPVRGRPPAGRDGVRGGGRRVGVHEPVGRTRTERRPRPCAAAPALCRRGARRSRRVRGALGRADRGGRQPVLPQPDRLGPGPPRRDACDRGGSGAAARRLSHGAPRGRRAARSRPVPELPGDRSSVSRCHRRCSGSRASRRRSRASRPRSSLGRCPGPTGISSSRSSPRRPAAQIVGRGRCRRPHPKLARWRASRLPRRSRA